MRGKTPARAGQVWRSSDQRETRRVRIISVTERPGYATVVPIDARGDDVPRGRRSHVRLDGDGRLQRYRLVR